MVLIWLEVSLCVVDMGIRIVHSSASQDRPVGYCSGDGNAVCAA